MFQKLIDKNVHFSIIFILLKFFLWFIGNLTSLLLVNIEYEQAIFLPRCFLFQ